MVNEYGVFHAVYALVGRKAKKRIVKMVATGATLSNREDSQPVAVPWLLLPQSPQQPWQDHSSLRLWG